MLGASVWLVSDVACKQSIQQVRESREALHVGRCVEERRGGGGGAAEHGGGTCLVELWFSLPRELCAYGELLRTCLL